MFDSLIGLTKDVVKIATAPIEIALDTTRLVTKPLAEASKEITSDIKETVNEPL